MDNVRLDKWLWAARCFKTRSQASRACGEGRVTVNGQAAKSSRSIRGGETIEVTQGNWRRTLTVSGLYDRRRSAALAAELFEEVSREHLDDWHGDPDEIDDGQD